MDRYNLKIYLFSYLITYMFYLKESLSNFVFFYLNNKSNSYYSKILMKRYYLKNYHFSTILEINLNFQFYYFHFYIHPYFNFELIFYFYFFIFYHITKIKINYF